MECDSSSGIECCLDNPGSKGYLETIMNIEKLFPSDEQD